MACRDIRSYVLRLSGAGRDHERTRDLAHPTPLLAYALVELTRVGTSKRYAHVIDARMDARIVESIMRTGGEPDSLDAKQLDLAHEPLTRSPEPQPARAWVRYGEQSIEIEVEVTAWTARAAAIRWPGPDGAEQRAWVWAGAVRGRQARQR